MNKRLTILQQINNNILMLISLNNINVNITHVMHNNYIVE